MASGQFPRRMTPAQANELMAALRLGKTLRRITNGGKFGHVIVSLTKLKKHCALYPEWGEEAMPLAVANAKAADRGCGRGLPIFRHDQGRNRGIRLPGRPRSADRTRSPAAVSQKREYFKYPPETIGDFSLEVAEFGV
jgi:hypothetical protein